MMYNLERERKTSGIEILQCIIFFLLIIVVPLFGSSTFLRYLTLFIIGLFCVLFLLLFREIVFNKETILIFILFCCALLCLCVLLFYGRDLVASLTRVVQFFSCFITFFVGMTMNFSNKVKKIIICLIGLFAILSIVYWMCSGCLFTGYAFLLKNPNTYASFLLCDFYFLFIFYDKKKMTIFIICLILLLILLTGSRTIIVSILLFFVVFCFISHRYNKKGEKSFASVIVLLMVLCFCVLNIFFTITFSQMQIGIKISSYIFDLTGKRLFSGRQDIWIKIVEAIKLKPFFGYGLDATPSLIYDTNFSCHNLFLQTILQVGIVGAIIVFCPLAMICIKLVKIKNKYSIVFFSILVSIFLHECFEVTLTQNLITVGLPMWCILGMGCKERGRNSVDK